MICKICSAVCLFIFLYAGCKTTKKSSSAEKSILLNNDIPELMYAVATDIDGQSDNFLCWRRCKDTKTPLIQSNLETCEASVYGGLFTNLGLDPTSKLGALVLSNRATAVDFAVVDPGLTKSINDLREKTELLPDHLQGLCKIEPRKNVQAQAPSAEQHTQPRLPICSISIHTPTLLRSRHYTVDKDGVTIQVIEAKLLSPLAGPNTAYKKCAELQSQGVCKCIAKDPSTEDGARSYFRN